jgi:hypothetical protein
MSLIPPPAHQVFGDALKKHARKHASFLTPLLAGFSPWRSAWSGPQD